MDFEKLSVSLEISTFQGLWSDTTDDRIWHKNSGDKKESRDQTESVCGLVVNTIMCCCMEVPCGLSGMNADWDQLIQHIGMQLRSSGVLPWWLQMAAPYSTLSSSWKFEATCWVLKTGWGSGRVVHLQVLAMCRAHFGVPPVRICI